MIRSFISRLLSSTKDVNEDGEDPITKRAYVRHDVHDCIAVIRGQGFRVLNWSYGGLVILADDGVFAEGQIVYMTLKFGLLDSKLEIVHQGTVIRSVSRRTAIRFDPLKPQIARGFQQVLDDSYARWQAKQKR